MYVNENIWRQDIFESTEASCDIAVESESYESPEALKSIMSKSQDYGLDKPQRIIVQGDIRSD